MSYDHKDNKDKNAEKRAIRNAKERKRCDVLKDTFLSLKNVVPSLQVHLPKPSKTFTRNDILTHTVDYIKTMKQNNARHLRAINKLKQENDDFESEIKMFTNLLATANYAIKSSELDLSPQETDISDLSINEEHKK